MLLVHFIGVCFLIKSNNAWIIQVDNFVDECFHEFVKQNHKVGFSFQVVDGETLDIDVTITGPEGHGIYEGRRISGKYSFSAYREGSYKFCFGSKSTVFAKTVMFEVFVDQPEPAEWHVDIQTDQNAPLDSMVVELSLALRNVHQEQQFLLVSNTLHRRVSEHTNFVLLRWALFEFCLIVLGSGFEVWYIISFFEVRRIV